ncbi:MAG: lamin tail domain-containing protein, partial [Prevotella sp.]|nr:lamin tail domain-containing protein [Prevotella sp.]
TTAATTATTNYYSTEAAIALPDGDVSLTACYREMTPAEMAEAGCHPVCVNEVSASNNALINEYGKKNDWVELYNATNEDVDIEGMYLSDNLDQPLKYKVTKGGTSANTIIPAHGYLIVWCDKLETTSQALHAPFKLAGEEGVVVLTAANGSWSDILQYGPHDGNSTVGRYPDGTADIYMMNVPTIQKTNILTSYMVKVEQGDFSGVRNPYIAAANGFRIYYTTQQLCIKSEEGKWAKVDIYTSDGRLVEQQTVTINHGAARLDVSHLPNGFYVARATDDQGSKVACKFAR